MTEITQNDAFKILESFLKQKYFERDVLEYRYYPN